MRHQLCELLRRSQALSGLVRHRGRGSGSQPEPDETVDEQLITDVSDLLDLDFYRAQTGQEFDSVDDGARHFVQHGGAGNYSPHPLITVASFPEPERARWQRDSTALLEYLKSGPGQSRPWSQFFDPARFGGNATPQERWTAVVRYLSSLSSSDVLAAVGRPFATSTTWGDFRGKSLDCAERVRGIATNVATDGSHDGRPRDVSIVIVAESPKTLTRCLDAVTEHQGDVDAEVVVVNVASNLADALAITATSAATPRASVICAPSRSAEQAREAGAEEARGDVLVFLDSTIEVRRGWLAPLLVELADSMVAGVQPVVLSSTDLIESAGVGVIAARALPVPLLVGLPWQARRSGRSSMVFGLASAAFAVRRPDFLAAHGFAEDLQGDLASTDLCLRLGGDKARKFLVALDSMVGRMDSPSLPSSSVVCEQRRRFVARWSPKLEKASEEPWCAWGLRVAHVGSDGLAVPAAIPVVVRESTSAGPRPGVRLRWGIKNPADGGAFGCRWGDSHFAESLRRALERGGQDAVIYRRQAHAAPATALDDVSLVVRGLVPGVPQPGKVNILWVISRPHELTWDEAAGFDLVYAGSDSWARKMTSQWGVTVRPLLQATDPADFYPSALSCDPAGQEVLFVGQARANGPRKIVMDALEVGSKVRVIGTRWERFIDPSLVDSSYFPYEDLPDLYRHAGIVLADHWGDMADEGFIANRLFDAVACGARVVSDEVAGIHELFGDSVQIYRTKEELRRLLDPGERASLFPTDSERLTTAEVIRTNHTFDQRAETLIRDVMEVLPRTTRGEDRCATRPTSR